jgi:hypothetical protein
MTRNPWPALTAALLVAPAGQAQVLIEPRVSTLLSGRTCAFRVRLVPPADRSGAAARVPSPKATWTWRILDGGPGQIQEASGVFTAATVTEPCLVKVRATCASHPPLQAEAVILVLPWAPFELVAKIQGPGWLEPYSSSHPFLNQATGDRSSDATRVVTSPYGWNKPLGVQYAGCGLPFTLRWNPQPGVEAERLSYQEGDAWIRKDVSGQDSAVITPKGGIRNFTMEALVRGMGPDGRPCQQSHLRQGKIHMRGLIPWAGNALAAPGHADGPGLAARFREPFGLARVADGSGVPRQCLVTDPQSHVLRLVSAKGVVSTPWGTPGQAGHRDNGPSLLRSLARTLGCEHRLGPSRDQGLFNGPTFLLALDGAPYRWPFRLMGWVVADSGNHVIRMLREDGTVSTVAGVPGQAGHRDLAGWDAWFGRKALFDTPQGLAEGPSGEIYVADQGNAVIRCLAPGGDVYTLAGSPGERGTLDGLGAQARFRELRGLALSRWATTPRVLYAVDGHAIRRITLSEGRVTTVLGQVDTPGFREIVEGSLPARRQAHRQPCLNHPCGILADVDTLVIADEGNHSVRRWSPPAATLVTLAGDPGTAELRWGLPRDGLGAPLDDRYATLPAPRTLVATATGLRLLVATGPCLAELTTHLEGQDRPALADLDCTPGDLVHPCVLRFTVVAITTQGEPSLRPVHYSVDFIEPDGTLAERCQGTGTTATPIAVQGLFSQRGTGTVVVRCATDQGVSAGARREVQVQ